MAESMNTGFAVQASYTADASVTYTVARAIEVYDVAAYATAAGGGAGAVQAFNGASALSDAITVDTDTNIGRAVTITAAQASLAVGGSLIFTSSGAAVGVATAFCVSSLISD